MFVLVLVFVLVFVILVFVFVFILVAYVGSMHADCGATHTEYWRISITASL